MRRRDGAAGYGALLMPVAVVATLALSGCDDTPAPVVAAPPSPAAQAQPRPTAQAQPVASADDGQNAPAAPGTAAPMLFNDPSAAADTPLCGLAARESNALSQSLLSRQYAGAGQCVTYACYDAATATYIGADGYRHVCR